MLGNSVRVCGKTALNKLNSTFNYPPVVYLVAKNFHTSPSSNANELTTASVARFPKGTGGRSSFSGNVATIFGATGVMGRILCNRLGKEGTQLIVPARGDIWDARSIKLVGDIGQVWLLEYDLRDPESIRKAVQHSNIVINCIGANYETRNFNYNDVHVEGPALIAKIAKECGVQKLIHFSSLNASLEPQTIYKKSKFLVSKYLGEQAVKDQFEDAIIIRPSNIYGESDKFLFYYTHEFRRAFTTIPLWRKGEMTIKMPVHQSDVADGIMKIIHNKDIKGVTYDFVGPETYLLSEIVDYIYELIQRPNFKRSHITPLRLAFAHALDTVMKRPYYNVDQIEREFISDQLSTDGRNPTLKDLGIKFRKFDEMVSWHLKVFNRYSYYNEKLGEFPDPKPPKPLSEDFEYQLRKRLRNRPSSLFLF